MGKKQRPSRGRRTRRITSRDRQILEHIAEFRAAHISVLHKRFFSDQQLEATRSNLRRLSTGPHHLIRAVPLDDRTVWYQLTSAGRRYLGVKKYDCRSLGAKAAARQFALQWLVFQSDRKGIRLIDRENLVDLFPIHNHRLPQGRFYLRTEAEQSSETGTATGATTSAHKQNARLKLGYVAIDYGGRPQRVAQRLFQTLRRFLDKGWFDELISKQRFEVTLLTITGSRRRAYEHSLPELMQRSLSRELGRLSPALAETCPITLHVRVVPGLLPIIYGRETQ